MSWSRVEEQEKCVDVRSLHPVACRLAVEAKSGSPQLGLRFVCLGFLVGNDGRAHQHDHLYDSLPPENLTKEILSISHLE